MFNVSMNVIVMLLFVKWCSFFTVPKRYQFNSDFNKSTAAVYCGGVIRLESCVCGNFCLNLLWLSEVHIHVGYEMKDEVLGCQGISQQDVGEVCEQLRSDTWHLTEGWWNNWKLKNKQTKWDKPFKQFQVNLCITRKNLNIKAH